MKLANIKSNEKLPVLFWIHGGAFFGGNANDGLYGPDFLIEKRVILVTSNYRLGVLGFLSLDLPEYSGNMGLKDIQLALKWTNRNIDRFGGDRKQITIFGHSAGGALTHYQVLSAESRSYFKNAIIMSGCAENQWALSNDDHVKRAHSFSRELGKEWKEHDDLVTFLKTVPAEKFIPFANMESINFVLSKLPIGPIIESMYDLMKELHAISIGVLFASRSGCKAAILARDASENIRNSEIRNRYNLYSCFNRKSVLKRKIVILQKIQLFKF